MRGRPNLWSGHLSPCRPVGQSRKPSRRPRAGAPTRLPGVEHSHSRASSQAREKKNARPGLVRPPSPPARHAASRAARGPRPTVALAVEPAPPPGASPAPGWRIFDAALESSTPPLTCARQHAGPRGPRQVQRRPGSVGRPARFLSPKARCRVDGYPARRRIARATHQPVLRRGAPRRRARRRRLRQPCGAAPKRNPAMVDPCRSLAPASLLRRAGFGADRVPVDRRPRRCKASCRASRGQRAALGETRFSVFTPGEGPRLELQAKGESHRMGMGPGALPGPGSPGPRCTSRGQVPPAEASATHREGAPSARALRPVPGWSTRRRGRDSRSGQPAVKLRHVRALWTSQSAPRVHRSSVRAGRPLPPSVRGRPSSSSYVGSVPGPHVCRPAEIARVRRR